MNYSSPDIDPVVCDPISLEIILGALSSAQLEAEMLLERTAMSPFIKEKKDYFVAFHDAQGEMVVGTVLPLFGEVVQPILEYYKISEMRPGDMYWYSDCYQSKGAVSHNSDQMLVTPVFVNGELCAFSQTWAHLMDVGGMRAGSITSDATDVYQEGMIIPPVRLVKQGEIQEELLRIFERNSRFPELLRGDMRALLAATNLGARRLREVFERFGVGTVKSAFDQVIHRTQVKVKQKFDAKFPTGHYRFVDLADTDGMGNGPFRLDLQMAVNENGACLDMTGTDDQATGPINFLMHPVVPSLMLGIYLLSDEPYQLLNAGAMKAIDEVKTRPGSLVAPNFPAALGTRSLTMLRVQSALTGLVNVATEGQGPAASSTYSIYYVRGIDPKTSAPFLLQDGVGAGYGARPFADGLDVIYYIGQVNYPVEYINSTYPVRIRQYAINPDSGGPGRWRGGCGVIREFELLCDKATLAMRIGNVVEPPYGVSGGRAAGSGHAVINPGTDREMAIAPLCDGVILKKGDVVRLSTGGGGGWGHPYERLAQQVLADVLGGFVTEQAALDDYGVMLCQREGKTEVDVQQTERIRQAPQQTGLFHRHEYTDTMY